MTTKKVYIIKKLSAEKVIISYDKKEEMELYRIFNFLIKADKPTDYSYCSSGRGYHLFLRKYQNIPYLKIDLNTAYNSITLNRVFGLFKYYNMPNALDSARLVCYNGSLARGNPSSNYILDLIMKRLDDRLSGLAESNGFYYARYVDDLVFYGENIKRIQYLLTTIRDIIKEEDFTINESKIVSKM